ncbi:MAG: SusC/RagA family TonB-linked outer membrane protein [bacterium]|nr:SusC/RagA family TonB-linked outer membrane protein [bacterium]
MLKNWISSKMLARIARSFLCLTLGVVLVVLAMDTSSAQSRRTITGTVTDAADGTGIPAVNVLVKGTLIGTSTGIDGTYSLSVPTDAETLVFSSIGYVTIEVQIDGRSTIDVEMSQDIQFLDDVVVVGYGAQDEKEITSSVATIGEAEFNQGNVNAPAQLLQGKVPGLSIYNKGGDPNSTPTIRLRGISTVGANTEPLVVIDGVIGASLDNVDPNDIETINVLKDGSAAAIYGSRGSSGVILVTTKKGERSSSQTSGEDNTRINYNGYMAIDAIQNEIDVMSPSEYINAGGNDLGSQTDWIDLVTRTSVSQVHNLSVSGGSVNTQYRVSTNFRDINGILEGSGFDQINARANINHSAIDNRLNVSLNFASTKREQNFSFNEALRYAALYNPTAPVRFDNGQYFQAILFDNFNPVAIIEQNVNEGERKDINFNAQADFAVTDNISVNANYGQQFRSFSEGEFYPSTSFFRGLNATGLGRRYFEDRKFTLFETYGQYRNTFDKINLDATIGYSFQEEFYENLLLQLGNLPSDELGYYGIDLSGDPRINGVGNTDIQTFGSPDERIIAYFGRLNLTFDDAIFFNASVRQEGSTKLGEDNQWGLFPAVGIGADILRYAPIDMMDQLKIRVGYGVTGALPGPSGLSVAQYTYDFNAQQITASNEPNPDLKWEEKAELNVGLDYALMDDRLRGAIDVYTRTINDFILEVDIPAAESITGATTQYQNVGELKTNGFEISLDYDAIVDQDMSWTTGLIFSTYNTTLEEFTIDEEMRANLGAPGQNSTDMIRVAVGEEIGQIWGPVFDGVADDGSPIFKDLNGDGQVIADQGNALADNGDFQQLGNGIPDFEIGWTNQFAYKNWDVNAFFRGAFGHSLVNTFRAFYEPIDPGAINSYNRIATDKAVDGLTVSQFSSLYVEKADFVKLDNFTIGYNFDTSEMSSFNRLRAYFSIQNAFTITNYSGIDPEPVLQDFGTVDNGGRPSDTPDVLSPGIDRRYNYFTARTFTFGVNIGF